MEEFIKDIGILEKEILKDFKFMKIKIDIMVNLSKTNQMEKEHLNGFLDNNILDNFKMD